MFSSQCVDLQGNHSTQETASQLKGTWWMASVPTESLMCTFAAVFFLLHCVCERTSWFFICFNMEETNEPMSHDLRTTGAAHIVPTKTPFCVFLHNSLCPCLVRPWQLMSRPHNTFKMFCISYYLCGVCMICACMCVWTCTCHVMHVEVKGLSGSILSFHCGF